MIPDMSLQEVDCGIGNMDSIGQPGCKGNGKMLD
jgi:hypothetical protein